MTEPKREPSGSICVFDGGWCRVHQCWQSVCLAANKSASRPVTQEVAQQMMPLAQKARETVEAWWRHELATGEFEPRILACTEDSILGTATEDIFAVIEQAAFSALQRWERERVPVAPAAPADTPADEHPDHCLPSCMMPEGAEPCAGYQHLRRLWDEQRIADDITMTAYNRMEKMFKSVCSQRDLALEQRDMAIAALASHPPAPVTDADLDDPPMCRHGTRESEGWCAQCTAFGDDPKSPVAPVTDADVERVRRAAGAVIALLEASDHDLIGKDAIEELDAALAAMSKGGDDALDTAHTHTGRSGDRSGDNGVACEIDAPLPADAMEARAFTTHASAEVWIGDVKIMSWLGTASTPVAEAMRDKINAALAARKQAARAQVAGILSAEWNDLDRRAENEFDSRLKQKLRDQQHIVAVLEARIRALAGASQRETK